MNARRHRVFGGLKPEGQRRACVIDQVVGEDRGIAAAHSRLHLIAMNVDLRPATRAPQFLQTAGVIEVKVANEEHVEISG